MKLFTIAFIFFSLFFGVFASDLLAQTTGDYRSNAALFNWTVTASWERFDGSVWVSNPAAQGYPGQNASGIAGTVTILNLHTVTLNVSPPQSIGNLVIASGGTFVSNTVTLNITGSFTNNGGTFTPNAGTITFIGTGAQAIDGTVATQTFNNIIVNKASGAVSVGGSTNTLNSAAFTLTQGTFNAPPTLTTTGTVTLTAGTFVAGADLNIGGTTASLTNNGGTFIPGSGTVSFTGSGAQAINGSAASQTFNNLVINKGNTLTVAGSTTTLNVVNLTRQAGNFTAPATMNISGSVLLTAGTYTAGANTNVGGDFTNNGGAFTPGGNTITFNGTGAQAINGTAATQTFNNLIANKASGSLSVSTASVIANGSITLTAGTFNAGANTSVAVNWTNNGVTFNPGVGTVTFTGGNAQVINGSFASQTFNNLVINKSGNTLTVGGSTTTLNVVNLTRQAGTFTAPATVNISGSVLLTAGIYTAGANTNVGGDFTNNGGTVIPVVVILLLSTVQVFRRLMEYSRPSLSPIW